MSREVMLWLPSSRQLTACWDRVGLQPRRPALVRRRLRPGVLVAPLPGPRTRRGAGRARLRPAPYRVGQSTDTSSGWCRSCCPPCCWRSSGAGGGRSLRSSRSALGQAATGPRRYRPLPGLRLGASAARLATLGRRRRRGLRRRRAGRTADGRRRVDHDQALVRAGGASRRGLGLLERGRGRRDRGARLRPAG